tara:strand:- start:4528 stop:5568 length:1041 start_codon:yes stop_codon:yes gene_type:complete
MRLLFVVTGFGYGDSIRAEAIINEFLKKDPLNDVLILGYDTSYKYFKNKFKVLEVEGYKFPDDSLEFKTHRFLIKNYYLPFSWIVTWRRHRRILKSFKPDLVISDFEPMALFIAKSLRKKCISIFGFDPKSYKEFPDKTQNLEIQVKFIKTLYKNSHKVIIPSLIKRKNHSNIYYTNPIIRKYKTTKNLMRKLKLRKQPILVMLGGSDFGLNLAKEIIKLSKNYKENFIIFGGSRKLSKNHFTNFNENFLDYLKACKGIITLAGNLTLSESLFFKKALLVFPIKNHIEQQLNAFNVRNHITIGKDLKKSLDYFIKNIKVLEKKAKKYKIKDTGAKEVVNIVYKIKK